MTVTTGTELLERSDELLELAGLIDEVCAGQGRLVLIEGPAGIGKTRLLDVARARGREREMRVLAARASELDGEFPLGVVRQLFEPLLARGDRSRRSRLLAGAAEPAAGLLGLGPVTRRAPAVVDDRGLAHFHALYWLVVNLAEETPLLLAIDDLHWADRTSLRFLEFLLPRLEGLPVLLALASRPAEVNDEARSIDRLATDPLARVLHPAPLSEAAVHTLLAAEVGQEPDHEFVAACREMTGGNPFLLGELTRELASDQVQPSRTHVGLVRESAPGTVSRAVLLRIARLGEAVSALARALAVLGDGTPLRRACALAGISDGAGADAAASLAHADIFARGRPLAFAHPVLRAAVYGDLEPADRARAHRRAADLLAQERAPADAIAVHLLETEPAGEAELVERLREAALRARERGASHSAVAFLRRALMEPPPPTERAALTLELAAAELRTGESARAAEHFEEGVKLAGDPRTGARCVWEWALALQAMGRHDESFAIRERVADQVAPLDAELALLIEVGLIASARLDLSRLKWGQERLDRQRGRPVPDSAAGERLRAVRAEADAMWSERPAAELADLAERALASGKLIDGARAIASTPFFYAVEVLLMADRVDPARQALDARVDRAREQGSALSFACASGWRCLLLAREGALMEAEADARSCAELSVAHGWFHLAPPMLGFVLSVLIERGELDEAQQLLEHTGMSDYKVDGDLALYPMLHARARLRAARGDIAGGRADFSELARRRARWNTHPTLVPAVLAAPVLVDDDAPAARARAEQLLREAETWGTARAIGMALHAAGLAYGGERGIQLLTQATAVLERSPAPVELAQALTDLGSASRRSGRVADARDPLRRALDLADSSGARSLAQRARNELRAAGARPRRPRLSGVEALTASERRIASMAAQGLSNREIAQALFLTKKTVEGHLSNAYRKLGIGSRGELPATLR